MLFKPPGQLVEAGGLLLHFHVSGSGLPAVILESGIAATSLSWALVESEIARFTTVLSYDRAGLGWSGPAITPRTPSIIAAELYRGLQTAGVSGPYILVGHSFGGLIVQRFAASYASEVAGLILADPLSAAEWYPASNARLAMLHRGIRLSRRGAILARWGVVGACLRALLAGKRMLPQFAARVTSGSPGSSVTDRLVGELRKLPRELWPIMAWHWSQEKNFEGMARHLECLPESAEEMAQCRLEPSLPVTVILAETASSAGLPPHWNVIHAKGSGHWVQLDRPDLVLDAVLRMVLSVRKPAVDTGGLQFRDPEEQASFVPRPSDALQG